MRPFILCFFILLGLVFPIFAYAAKLIVTPSPASGTFLAQQSVAIYELGKVPALRPADIGHIARPLGLAALTPPVHEGATAHQIQIYTDQNGITRLVFFVTSGNMTIFPNFLGRVSPAPPAETAIRLAQRWADANGILKAAMPGIQTGEVTTTAREDVTEAGPRASVDVLRTVHFYRQLDGLRVIGKDSIVSVDVGSEGVVGAIFSMRSIIPSTRRPTVIITPAKALEDFHRQYDAQIKQIQTSYPDYQLQLGSPRLIYYEQGLKYVQPVYRFDYRFSGRNGKNAGDYIGLVAASVHPPEKITFPLIPASSTRPLPTATTTMPAITSTIPPITTEGVSTKGGRAHDPFLGIYSLYNDDPSWISDGDAFSTSFAAGQVFASLIGIPEVTPVSTTQNLPDAQWMWEPDPTDGVSDRSLVFVGQVNFAVHEGHGNFWQTEMSNGYVACLDPACTPDPTYIYASAGAGLWGNLSNIFGYGPSVGNGRGMIVSTLFEITNYILWKGCAIIPAPGDPFDQPGNWNPGGPKANWWDLWRQMFQGMKGAYGFRTEMWIADGTGGPFATNISLGVPNLNAWLSAVDNNALGHEAGLGFGNDSNCETAPTTPSTDIQTQLPIGHGYDSACFTDVAAGQPVWSPGMEYASAVIVSGHENDIVYDTSKAPPQTQTRYALTIWWQHQ